MEFDSSISVGTSSIYGNPQDLFKNVSIKDTFEVPYLESNQIIVDEETKVQEANISSLRTNVLNVLIQLKLLSTCVVRTSKLASFNASKFLFLVNVTSNIQNQIDSLKEALINTGTFTPAGTIISSVARTVPPNYLVCNGQLLDKNKYPALYKAIGVAYTITIPGYKDGGAVSKSVNMSIESIEQYAPTYAPKGNYFAVPNFLGLMQSQPIINSNNVRTFYEKYSSSTTVNVQEISANIGYPMAESIKYHTHSYDKLNQHNQNIKTTPSVIDNGSLDITSIPISTSYSSSYSKGVTSSENNNFILSNESVPPLFYIHYFIKSI